MQPRAKKPVAQLNSTPKQRCKTVFWKIFIESFCMVHYNLLCLTGKERVDRIQLVTTNGRLFGYACALYYFHVACLLKR